MSRHLGIHEDWRVILYDGDYGGDKTALSGGILTWNPSGTTYTSSASVGTSQITLKHVKNTGNSNEVWVYPTYMFSTSGNHPELVKTNIHILAKRDPGGSSVIPYVLVYSITGDTRTEYARKNLTTGTSWSETVVDLTGITGAYIGIYIVQPGQKNVSTTQYTYIKKIWFE